MKNKQHDVTKEIKEFMTFDFAEFCLWKVNVDPILCLGLTAQKFMIFSNLRHDNWWSRDNFSNQITDADKACRSSEISVDLIIIIVFL